ncbi:mitochondrial protein Pet127-domain-containing protein [Cladorrhinum sp. PSN259]|nr:mitochondrial protein Pet127-domain-containing protein [Cladorrhinum sp. PSN259]
MLQLARQARSALKSPFVCPACRVLLVSGFGPGISAARLPTAVANIRATRHQLYYSTQPAKPEEPEQETASEKVEQVEEAKGKKAKKGKQPKIPKEKKEKKVKGKKTKEVKEAKPAPEPKKQSPPTSSKKKKTPVPPSETEKLELWKQTLDVLKEIKEGTVASIPAGVTAGLAESTLEAKKQPKNVVGEDAGPARSPDKLLAGALTVLKRVLKQEAAPAKVASRAAARKKAAEAAKAAKAAAPKIFGKVKSPAKKASARSTKASASKATKKGEEGEDEEHKLILPLAPKGSASKKTRGSFVISSVNPDDLIMRAISKPQPPVPGLAYGLDRVLFNPGVYHLQDPRSRVYNFDPYLGRIMPIEEFDFQAIKTYVTSSKDTTLIKAAAQYHKKYTGSTSSMTSTLAHFHFLLSSWRPINAEMMSRSFQVESDQFTRIMKAPAATFLHWRDGTYAIDADKQFDTANVLSMLGKSMEKLLTLPKEHFELYRKSKSDQLSDEERNGPEAYHYTTLGDFMMRSQLDAFDPRVPGSGMFDLKTRAVISIRMDAQGYEKGLGYEIRRRHGQWQSFEREYYDMIRSAFLKYSLQVRMGRMDGIFVAFHNTERIFGFQYIPLPEMDLAIHGTSDLTLGGREFKLSIHLLNKVLDKATKKFPEQTLRLHFETRPGDPPFMYIFAKPVTPEEIHKIQGASAARIEEFERKMMGIEKEQGNEVEDSELIAEEEDGLEEIVDIPDRDDGDTSLDVWEDAMLKVEDALENEEQGVTAIREAIQEALLHSGLIGKHSPEETEPYVDALLTAMTSEAQNQPSKSSASDDVIEESDEVNSLDSVESAADSDGEVVEAEIVYEDEEVDVEMTNDPSSPKEQQSLKDLIERLANQVRQQKETRVRAETLKLRDFERILSELVTKSQELGQLEEEKASEVVEAVSSSVDEIVDAEAQETQDPEASTSAATEGEPSESDEIVESEQPATVDEETDGVYGVILTVRNKVNGKYVERPEDLKEGHSWDVEYAMEEIEGERAEKIYKMVLARRQKVLDNDSEKRDTAWATMFQGKLAKYSNQGRRFRKTETQNFRTRPVHVYGQPKPFVWSSVFDRNGNALESSDYKPWVPSKAILEKYKTNTDKLNWLESLIHKKDASTAEGESAANVEGVAEDDEGVAVEEHSEIFDEDSEVDIDIDEDVEDAHEEKENDK